MNSQPYKHTYTYSTRILTWAVLLSTAITAVSAFYIGQPEILPSLPYKRSAMDLAMMQVYRICDGDKNGMFTKEELQCVQRVISILFTGR